MVKKAKIVMLPHNNIDTVLTLYKDNDGEPLELSLNLDKLQYHTNQHLYALSDEDLIDGDYFIWYSQNNDSYEVHKYHSDVGYGIKTYTNFNYEDESSLLVNHSGNCGKIVKSTDNLEIKTQFYYGLSSFIALDRVPPFNKEFIKKYISHYNKGKYTHFTLK